MSNTSEADEITTQLPDLRSLTIKSLLEAAERKANSPLAIALTNAAKRMDSKESVLAGFQSAVWQASGDQQ